METMEQTSRAPLDAKETTSAGHNAANELTFSMPPPDVGNTTVVDTTTRQNDAVMETSATPSDVNKTSPETTSDTPPNVNKSAMVSIVQTTMGPSSRRRLRPFLIDKLNSGQFKGLRWLDKAQGKFRIPWKHGAKQGWSPDDSRFFKEWARHTGRFVEGVDNPQWSAWKTRIRCAFNKSPDILELKAESNMDDPNDPYKVYKFLGPIDEPTPDSRNHKGTQAWLCKLCSRGFPDVTSRINHKCTAATSSPSGFRQYACAKCSYKTENFSHFAYHLRSHGVERSNNNTVSEASGTGRVVDMKSIGVKHYACNLCSFFTEKEVEYEQHQHAHVMETEPDTAPEARIPRQTTTPDSTHSAKKIHPHIVVVPKPPAENKGQSRETTPPIDLSVMSRMSIRNSRTMAPINLSSSPDSGPSTPPVQLPVNSRYIFANDRQSQIKGLPINMPVNARQPGANITDSHTKTPPINLRLCALCDYCTLCGDDLERHLKLNHNKTVSPKDKLKPKVRDGSEKVKLPTDDSQQEGKKQELQDTQVPKDTKGGPSQKYVVEINLPPLSGGETKAAPDVNKDGSKKLISFHDLKQWSTILDGAPSDRKKVLVLQPTVNKPMTTTKSTTLSPPAASKLMTSSPSANKPKTVPSKSKGSSLNTSTSTIKSPLTSPPTNIGTSTSVKRSQPGKHHNSTNPETSMNNAHVEPPLPNSKHCRSKDHVKPSGPSAKPTTRSEGDTESCIPTDATVDIPHTDHAAAVRPTVGEMGMLTTLHDGNFYRVTSKQHSDPHTGSVYSIISKKTNSKVNTVTSEIPVSPSTVTVNTGSSYRVVNPAVNAKAVTSSSTSPIVRISPLIGNSDKTPLKDHTSSINANHPGSINVSTVISRRQASIINRSPTVSHDPKDTVVHKTTDVMENEIEEAKESSKIVIHDESISVLRHRLNDAVSFRPVLSDSSSTMDVDLVTGNQHCDLPTTDVPLDLSSKSKVVQDHPSTSSTQPVNLSKNNDPETKGPEGDDVDGSPPEKPRKERVRHNPNPSKQLQRLRPWLIDKLNAGNIKGLYWLNKQKAIFRISWKHGGKHDWSPEYSQIFMEWAKHTGKYREGANEWAKWKTRIRCAFNKSPEIVELKELANIGAESLDPYKVYMFIDPDKDPPQWPCDVCFDTFLSVDARNAHRLSHNEVVDVKPSLCPLCGFCTLDQDLYEHQCTNSSGTVDFVPVVFDSCNDGGATEETAVRESYLCDLCPYSTESQAEYDLHCQTHRIGTVQTLTNNHGDSDEDVTAISSFTCEQCKYSTVSQEEYAKHLQSHGFTALDPLSVGEEFEECSDEEIAVIASYVCEPGTDDMETDALYHEDQWTLVKESDDSNSPKAEPSVVDEVQSVKDADVKSYTCDQCGSRMDTQELLEVHLQSHNISTVQHEQSQDISGVELEQNQDIGTFEHEQPHIIGTVKMITVSLDSENNRYHDIQSDVKPYRCEDCDYCTVNKEEYELHRDNHQLNIMDVHTLVKADLAKIPISDDLETEAIDTKPYRCQDCGYCAAIKEDFEDHQQSHHINEEQIKSGDDETRETAKTSQFFICEVCGKVHKKRHDLDNHLSMHIKEKLPACLHCGQQFKTPPVLDKHLKSHTMGENGSPLACEVCGTEQRDALMLKKHSKVHWTKMLHTCALCKEVFPIFTTYMNHIKNHNKESRDCSAGTQKIETPQFFICEVCGKAHKKRQDLDTHLWMHIMEKAPACLHCGKQFTSSKVLNKHLKSHTIGEDGAPLACKVCAKEESDAYVLKKHMKEHWIEMSHTCKVCKAVFQYFTTYKMHVKNHDEGSRQMDASNGCGKPFSQLVVLDAHNKDCTVDTQAMPHECKYCGERFSNVNSHEDHLQSRHIKERQIKLDGVETEETTENPQFFICEVCGKPHKERYDLDTHLWMHIMEKAPACLHCGKQLQTMSVLHKHLRSHTTAEDGAPLACKVCGKEERDAFMLKKHSKEHWTKMSHTCSLCKAVFQHFTTYKIHVKNHDKESRQMYPCKKCGKGFSQLVELDAHSKECSAGTQAMPYECKYCGEQFNDVDSLFKHSKIHNPAPAQSPKPAKRRKTAPEAEASGGKHGGQFVWNALGDTLTLTKQLAVKNAEKRVLVCSDCARGHSQRASLKAQTPTIRDIMYNVCSECGDKFRQGWDRQIYVLPNMDKMDHVCSYCDKRYSQKSSLEAHLLKHTATAENVCSECGKGFVQKSSLEAHMLNHTCTDPKNYPFECSDCGKRYKNEFTCRAHSMLVHNVMKHACKDCGKGFSEESGLRMHALTHTAKMDYTCSFCGNAYSKESSLKAHMLTHPAATLEFLCSDCGESFSQESSLKTHSLTHTSTMDYERSAIEYYQCRLCVRGFIHREDLDEHLQHHNG